MAPFQGTIFCCHQYHGFTVVYLILPRWGKIINLTPCRDPLTCRHPVSGHENVSESQNPRGIQQNVAIQRNDFIHDGLRILIESRWDSLVLGEGHRVSLVPRSTLCWVVKSLWDSKIINVEICHREFTHMDHHHDIRYAPHRASRASPSRKAESSLSTPYFWAACVYFWLR